MAGHHSRFIPLWLETLCPPALPCSDSLAKNHHRGIFACAPTASRIRGATAPHPAIGTRKSPSRHFRLRSYSLSDSWGCRPIPRYRQQKITVEAFSLTLQKPTQRALRFALHGKRAFREAHIPVPRYTSCPLLSLRSGTAVL